MRARVEEELDQSVKEGILEPVRFSEWARRNWTGW